MSLPPILLALLVASADPAQLQTQGPTAREPQASGSQASGFQASGFQEPAALGGAIPIEAQSGGIAGGGAAEAQGESTGEAPSEPARKLVAVVGGTVHTQVPGQDPAPATLLIEGDRVRAVLAPDEPLPEGVSRIIDVEGKHVVPGLIDGLVYFDAEHDPLYLSAGVTLVRDLGSEPELVLQERLPAARERTPGPSVLTAGALLDGSPPSTAEAVVLDDPEKVQARIQPLLDLEVDFLSVQPNLGEPSWRKVLELGAESGLDVWGHVPAGVELQAALAAGHLGLLYLDALLPPGTEWAFVLPMAFGSVADQLVGRGAAVVPLLSGVDTRLRRVDVNPEQDAADSFFLEHVSPFYEAWWRADVARRRELGEDARKLGDRVRKKQLSVLALLHDKGVRLLPGSSAPQPWFHPGMGLHSELALWAEAGIAPADILYAVTRGAAEIVGVSERYGSLAPGLSADFLVVAADPRRDIGALREPSWVGVRGRVLDRADLNDLLATLRIEQRRAREEVSQPLEVLEPPMPEGDVILAGQVETGTAGMRVGAERYAVVREPDGRLSYCGRIVSPGSSVLLPSETIIVQRVRDGRLEAFEFAVRQGEHELRVEGLEVAGRMNVRRTFDGHPGEPVSTLEKIAAVSVGSVTALMMVAQLGPLPSDDTPPYAILHFHEGQEPEVVPWYLALDERGVFVLLSPQGNHGFLVAPNGSVSLWEQRLGQANLTGGSVAVEDFGGAGHPLPAELAERVAQRRAMLAEAAAAAASAPRDGEQTTPVQNPEPTPMEVPQTPVGAGSEG